MNTVELQQALYDRLVAQVGAQVVAVYTDVPQASESESDSAFPYITIGPFNGSPFDTKSDDGATILADVHIWARSHTSLSWRAIGDSVYDALQKYDALPITGADVIDCRFDSSTHFDDPDGKTKHYVLTFNITYTLT